METNSEFKDKKGLLVFFGIIKLMFGLFSFLFFIVTLFSVFAMQNTNIESTQQITFSSVFMGLVMYLVLSAIFISLGIGSIKKTRWARTLTLLLSWFTFITGIVMSIFMILFMNDIFNNVNSATQNDPNIMLFVKIFIFTFFIIFFLIIPGIFILFFQRKSVIRTVQKYDEKERWTDKCPLPLLALSFILLYTSISPLFYVSFGFVAPFFGTFLLGLPAGILLVINSIVCIYLAIQIYKLKIRSWYHTFYLFLFWIISFAITMIFNNFMDIYKLMNIPDYQLRMIESMGFLTNKNILIMSSLSFIPFMAFFIYTKKFFKNDEVVA